MPSTSDLVNAIRFLSIDAVERAQSGHPGMPLGMADIAYVLWHKHLRHHPKNPKWFNRDRFVLSNGHGSMLLYALLHLTGYKLSLDDIKAFRQLHSKTPGHPEVTDTPGVETTTGPLGQGLANAVGMALAEKIMAARFNRPNLPIVDHHTYVFVGDGCLMEGISHEVCSLAGTLGLNKLIAFYDDNGISIDGKVNHWFTDDTKARFQAYHWHVIGPVDGHDHEAIDKAIIEAKQQTDKPTLIILKTTIGFGSPVANSEKAHGAPLGAEATLKTRQALNWPYAAFEIPDNIYKAWNAVEKGQALEQDWLTMAHRYQQLHQNTYHQFLRQINGDLPDDWAHLSQSLFEETKAYNKSIATRKASQYCIEHFAKHLPEMFGGSADLTGSNNTDWSQTTAISKDDCTGNYLHYGVREFGMSAIMNGIALHGGLIPYGGTFLVFADYARNALRLSAIMKLRVIYVLTHDSIGLGEDGPTHQPIEHAAMLRLTPNMEVWRPASLLETAVAWARALSRFDGPSSLLLSRQNLAPPNHQHTSIKDVQKGGYIIADCEGQPDAIIIATGSELELALKASEHAHALGHAIRVVSMPCAELFLKQDSQYQDTVIPKTCRKRLIIEAAASGYWYRFSGLDGKIIGLEQFGLSAKGQDAFDALGFSQTAINEALLALLVGE